MKKKVIYGLVVTLFLSVIQFNLSSTYGDKIDYKKIFKNECQKCHERDGKGTKRGKELGVPDFTDAKWQASVTDEQLIKSITNGKKKMPKQEGRLSPEEIKAMVKYVRFFGPKKRR
jgi:mono/diheme cytochrome c family protein